MGCSNICLYTVLTRRRLLRFPWLHFGFHFGLYHSIVELRFYIVPAFLLLAFYWKKKPAAEQERRTPLDWRVSQKGPKKSFKRLTWTHEAKNGFPPPPGRAASGTITWHNLKKNMAAVGRLFRLSTFTVAAGAALKISKDVTDRRRNSSQNSNLELVLVQIAFRHGARTPIFPAPCQELEPVTWQADLLMGPLPHTDFDYELKHVSGGARPFSRYDDRQMKKILKVMYSLYCLRLDNNVTFAPVIEIPTLKVPGKGRRFDIDPSQKASISLPPEGGVQIKPHYPWEMFKFK